MVVDFDKTCKCVMEQKRPKKDATNIKKNVDFS